jgi:hypothetical protein
MATFSTWAALRTAILDALATYVDGSPCTGSYSIGSRTMNYRSIKELKELYQMTFELEAIENAGDSSGMVSYARYSRY